MGLQERLRLIFRAAEDCRVHAHVIRSNPTCANLSLRPASIVHLVRNLDRGLHPCCLHHCGSPTPVAARSDEMSSTFQMTMSHPRPFKMRQAGALAAAKPTLNVSDLSEVLSKETAPRSGFAPKSVRKFSRCEFLLSRCENLTAAHYVCLIR